jgi:hypothetical protein
VDQGKDTGDASELAEIVATAQKRSESINNVGMSISAISGDSLVRRGITDVSQLSRVVPGWSDFCDETHSSFGVEDVWIEIGSPGRAGAAKKSQLRGT